jgi:hypothetical protein
MTNYLGFGGTLWSSLMIRRHKLKKTHEDSFDRMLTLFGSIKEVFQPIDVQSKIAGVEVIGIAHPDGHRHLRLLLQLA